MDFFRAATPKLDSAQLSQQQQQQQKQDEDPTKKKADDSAKTESPLDQYSDLFKNDPNAKPQDDGAPKFDIDPKKIADAASKTNFAGALPSELLVKIAAGGEDGMKAAVAAMNSVAQNSYAQSTVVTGKLIEQALQRQATYFQETVIPQITRQMGSEESLRELNPILNHSAVQPVAAAIRSSLAEKNPDATPKEIAKMTNDFFSALASAVTPPSNKGENTQQGRGQKEQDWSKFLN
jgi:hypothetical protein